MEKRLMMFIAGLFLSMGVALAQTQVNGTVTSADDGEPVIGASIRVEGTKTGTVTDINGNFQLSAPAGSTLVVSYLGMESQKVKAGNNLSIALHSDSRSLDEVIVTGYGTFKKSSFTGAASTMDATKLEDLPVVSLTDKLAGSIPGVQVTSSSSSPGAVASIRIRGMGSINAGNDPLFVIDGTPVNSGNISELGSSYNDAGTDILASINSNDIESMTVIKDAAAASLYGSRAANGVIVITTKSGKAGKTHVDFRSDWGFSDMAVDYRPTLNGADRRELLSLGLKNYALDNGKSTEDAVAFADSNIDSFAAMPTGGYTDWKDLLFKTGNHANYQVSLSGGSDKTRFYTSLAYTKQEGIVANQGLERFTGNANITHSWGRFTLRFTSLLSKMNQDMANEGTSYDGALFNYTMAQNPSSTPYDEDGNLLGGCGLFGTNPLYEQQHSSDRNVLKRAFNTLQVTYNIWDKLNLSEKIAYDFTEGQEDVLWDRYSNNGGPGGVMQRVKNGYNTLNTQTQLTYINDFGNHHVDALLGFETEEYNYSFNYLVGQDYPGNQYELSLAGTTSAQSDKVTSKMTSFLGRVDYDYADKYYAGASYRLDGSSRLARDNRWGSFWSVSAAWRFAAEKFMSAVSDVITDGKIRVSYGVNGTQPSDAYGYMNLFNYGIGINYGGIAGGAVTSIGNPDLKWEKNKSFNIGLDMTFFNRLSLTFDYYNRTTSDLIYDMPMSAVPGFVQSGTPSVPYNIGSLVNKGFELTLTSTNFRTKDFDWTTSLNLAHNSNKVDKLTGTENEVISGILIHRVGEPYYSYYMYEYAGVDRETGAELYYINDGTENARKTTSDVSKANRVIVGNHEATIEGGLTNTLRWKFIDLGFTFTFSLGGDAVDYATWQHSNGDSYLYQGAVPSYYKAADTWTPENKDAKLPKFQYGNTGQMSSRWLMPTDYLRLKTFTLGFSVPTRYLQTVGLSKARIYFSASNLLTWKSDDLLVDPEMPVSGVCTLETPALRTLTFGVEIGF